MIIPSPAGAEGVEEGGNISELICLSLNLFHGGLESLAPDVQ